MNTIGAAPFDIYAPGFGEFLVPRQRETCYPSVRWPHIGQVMAGFTPVPAVPRPRTIELASGTELEGLMTRLYQYDVFISYQRTSPTVPLWIKHHFYPRLSELLDDNADFEVKIFYDEHIPAGVKWPEKVQGALRRTRILLPVCSPKYFQDEWCLAEWHSMAKREEILGMSSAENAESLIYPVIFSDSKNFPEYARERRMRSFKDLNQPYPHFQASAAYLEFHREMGRVAAELVEIIERTPEWRPDWPVTMPKPEPPRRPRLPRL
jgi:hypothetical protein